MDRREGPAVAYPYTHAYTHRYTYRYTHRYNRRTDAKDLPDLDEKPTLFLELEGVSEEAVSALAEVARGCCDELGGGAFAWASNESERRKLWAARHGTYYASLALRPGSRGIVTDAVVPISRLAEVMTATAEDVDRCGVVGPIFGHAGDGNFHCILLVTLGFTAAGCFLTSTIALLTSHLAASCCLLQPLPLSIVAWQDSPVTRESCPAGSRCRVAGFTRGR